MVDNSSEYDMVNHPAHYTSGGIECIDAIEAALFMSNDFAGYLKGNVIKYLWRCSIKGNELEDLKKAQWYLNKLIDYISSEQNKDG